MKKLLKFSTLIIAICIGLFIGIRLPKNDLISFLSWWVILFILGLSFLPLSQTMFSKFDDRGYLFSKIIGIALPGYIMWLLSSIRVLKFTSLSCVLVVVVCILFNIWFYYSRKNKSDKYILSPQKWKIALREEILFFLFFLIWTYIRGFKPEAYGTEKFMDYGFMTSMMRSEYMPPQDLWFAGETINYYYVGQYLATFLTKLSFVTVNVGYNLMLMTLAAFGFLLPFSLVYNIVCDRISKNNKSKCIPVIAGLLAGSGVSLAGNMHFVLYYKIVPVIRKLFSIEGGNYSSYFFPDSTRYIGYDPETADKTIHEFPSYSFVLGDLHAHVLNIIFVLTVLALLYAWLQYKRDGEIKSGNNALIKDIILIEVVNPFVLMISFFIGLFHTTNFWDFPIYFVVSGAIIFFSNIKLYGFKIKLLLTTAFQGLFVLGMAKIVALPFTLNFRQISTEIYLAESHTPFYQLVILWGLPAVLVGAFLIHIIKDCGYGRDSSNALSDTIDSRKHPIDLFFKQIDIGDLFIITIGLCAFGLILIPELIYVKDIYSGDYKRANTMFKLTYQAFIMFGITIGYIITKFILLSKITWNKIIGFFGLYLFVHTLWYTKVAVYGWYGDISNQDLYQGLDSAAFMEHTMNDDYLATNWLSDNVNGMPVILEANGDSYSDYERVSVITGLPTVLGWYVHEWLWRGDLNKIEERVGDIRTIYTSNDRYLVLELIKKYNIEYIYVGKLEYDKFPELNDDLLKSLGEMVFLSPTNQSKDYETYIISID